MPARLLRLASDDRLVEYLRNGSEPAFEAVFERHHRAILAFCRHMLGSAEEAEDAVQHTFMAAYRSLVGSDRPIQLRPWLYTVARNRCLSLLRARREKPLDDLGDLPTENLSAEVQRRQDLRDLLRDVGELPEEQRAALVLAEVGGVSHDEIAQVLGVQREKVKALVFQARSSLIASRDARETPCDEIREQLAELRGGALRRNTLRRHLSGCPGCREFRTALQEQRKMLALALPVVPSLALKQAVMAGTLGSGAAAASGAGGAAGAAAGGSLLAGGGAAVTAKVLAVAAIAGGGAVALEAGAPHEQPPTRTAPAGQIGRDGLRAPAGMPASHGGAAPAALGGSVQQRSDRAAQQRPDGGAVAGTRRSLERSKGRRGRERRSERASERAAGPAPEHAKRAEGVPAERALERRDARGPDERSQGAAKRPERTAAREPKLQGLARAESAPRPAPAPKPEKAPKQNRAPEPAAPAAVAEPAASASPAPALTPEVDRKASGKAKG
jgi:RNA polymerase sigma factor (sigma-70 family)